MAMLIGRCYISIERKYKMITLLTFYENGEKLKYLFIEGILPLLSRIKGEKIVVQWGQINE